MGDTTKINLGCVETFVKAYASGMPGNDPISGNTVIDLVANGWTALGFPSEDGVNEAYTPEFFDSKSACARGTLKKFVIDEQYQLTLSMLESDLAKWQYAIAGSTYTAAAVEGTNPNQLKVGGKLTFPEYSFAFTGLLPNGNTFVIFVPKVTSIGPSATDYNKSAEIMVPMVLEALLDTTRTVNEQLYIKTELTSPDQANTTLTTPGVDEAVTTIPVVSTTGFSSSGNILIDNETMAYASVDATNFLTVTRSVAVSPNEAAAHTTGATVLEVP